MLREVGRLTLDDTKEIHERVEKIFKQLLKKRPDLAEKKIYEIANTANYFIREEMGKELAQYPGDDLSLDEICYRFLEDDMYGVRATALFYFYNKYQKNPHKILEIIGRVFETIPWESESLCFYMWKTHTSEMKEVMLTWQKSPNEKKRALSIHGMENIAARDPKYIMEFLSNLLTDENEEVQKKVSHVLTQTCRVRSATCYPILKTWLEDGNETVIKTVWVTMKKLTNILGQKSQSNKSHEFVTSTQKVVKEWRNDSNEFVASMGQKLSHITKNKK